MSFNCVKKICIAAFAIVPAHVFAYTFFVHPVFPERGHFYVAGTVATIATTLGSAHPRIFYGNLLDRYPVNDSRSTAVGTGIQAGYELPIVLPFVCPRPVFAFGLGYYQVPDTEYIGQVVQTAYGTETPLYNNKFHVKNNYLMVEGQLTWIIEHIGPFLRVGVGPAWNRMYHYSDNTISPNTTVLPAFQAHTETQLAYQFGFGITFVFNYNDANPAKFQHERLSFGYRYTSLGDSSFGSRGPVYPYVLDFGRITSNELYLSYTHLF